MNRMMGDEMWRLVSARLFFFLVTTLCFFFTLLPYLSLSIIDFNLK